MKRALLILFSFGICHLSFGQISYPEYRMTNGIPDVAGFQVESPTPNGGLVVYKGKDGRATASPIKIRRYQPEDTGRLLLRRDEAPVLASEMFFDHDFLPSPRTNTNFITPIPLRDRRLQLEVPFEPSIHLMPFHLSPVYNENPIFEDMNIRDFNPRRDD